ncbi:MAG: hypothetical protein PHG05_03850 [Candidatus Nanoarchaeia archaeon]|nr:hypothetical protein [Candidatus Nanoarchaeia archaeon]
MRTRKNFFENPEWTKDESLLERITEAEKIIKKDFSDDSKFYFKKGRVLMITPSAKRIPLTEKINTRVDQSSYDYFAWILVKSDLTKDKRYRGFRIINLIEARDILDYEKVMGRPRKEDISYSDTSLVGMEGGKYKLTVPSRTIDESRYEFTAEGIPLIFNNSTNKIAASFSTTHQCRIKDNLIPYGARNRMSICEHEICGFWKIASLENSLDKNKIPLIFGMFSYPNDGLMNHYHSLIMTKKGLTEAVLDICLWFEIKDKGYDNCFIKSVELHKYI